jgi:hypothetical protein
MLECANFIHLLGRHAGEHNRPFARELNLTFFLWYHLHGSLVDAYNKGCLSLEVDYGELILLCNNVT